ncbi:MAG TPA: L,D-transpeptidase family protein [Chthonomonadaceae bacterium]|nr:L,D-transpeptidase family protein [Chthonomonadaceae bacterium]
MQARLFISLLILSLSLSVSAAREQAVDKIQPLVGQETKYTVKRGDTLMKIARHYDINPVFLARLNHLTYRRLRRGRTLLLPTLHILPRNPKEGIVLNVPERAVYVFREGNLVGRYPVAVGKPSWQTALGEYYLANKKLNPVWKPTPDMVEREDIKDEPVPPGPENPLGDRWMGWSRHGFGFHSTNAPHSVGRVTTHGCVRLYPEAAHKMFDQVRVGMPIYSVYKPVLIGQRDGQFYLSVYPDIYDTGQATLAHVQKILGANGLLPLVDEGKLRAIVARKDGYPHRIVGTEETITVNGQDVKAPVAPTYVRGRWIVPAKEVVEAMGGQMLPAEHGARKILLAGHTLLLKPGQKTAQRDNAKVELSVAPTVVEGTLMAPLRLLTSLTGAHIAQEGQTLALTTGNQVVGKP